MSQPSSSIVSVSADNSDLKYKKALKEISKLMAANRALRENSDKSNVGLKDKIDQLSLRYEDLERQYDACRKQKQSLSHFLDEIQKQRNNLDREVGILNEVLAEQGATLRKYQLQSDEKAMAALIRTYENKEAVMNKNIAHQQEIITRLKNHIEKQENQICLLEQEKRNIEDKYNRAAMEINRYQELNQSLMNQNERILMEHSYKEEKLGEKEKQIEILANEFRSHIGLLKSGSVGSEVPSEGRINENIQQLLGQKNRISLEYTKLKDAYDQIVDRERYYYEIEEKLKVANLKAERAVEEANMLKSKIVVLQAKQFLQEAGEDEYGNKQFQQRLAMMVSQNDPLNILRNGDDTSHFKVMKSFLVDMQDKIYKLNQDKAHSVRKYKSIKEKFIKYARQSAQYEQQNKLLKGKLEGYERLAEKLHYQLEKELASHEQEVTRMSLTSNNILSKKTEQHKAAITFLNSQIESSQQKMEKLQRNLRQQNDTLKLELESLRSKFSETSDKSAKEKQFVDLYKKKNHELNSKINKLEEELAEANESSNRWERLFKEQKSKGEGLISQKQQLITRNRQLVQELDKKSEQYNESLKNKEFSSDEEIKKLRSELQHLRDELQYTSRELHKAERDLEDRRGSEEQEVQQIKRISARNYELEAKNNQYKKRIREIEDENQTIKLKGRKIQQNYERGAKLEEEVLMLTDKINDLTRDKLSVENQLKLIQGQYLHENKQNQELKRELSEAKLKSMDSSHQIRRQFENKILENKRTIQSLNQQISDLTAQIREEKSKNMRMAGEVNNLKSQKNRIQENYDQNRKKDFQVQTQIGDLKLEISQLNMENQRLQNELKNQNYNINNLNLELESYQQKIFAFNQEISALKIKVETADDQKNDLIRDLNALKFIFSAIDAYVVKAKAQINLKWEEESFIGNCSDLLNRIRKIGRLYGINYETANPVYATTTITTETVTNKNTDGNDAYGYFKTYAKGDGTYATHNVYERSVVQPLENKFESSQSFKYTESGNQNLRGDYGIQNISEEMNPSYNLSSSTGGYQMRNQSYNYQSQIA